MEQNMTEFMLQTERELARLDESTKSAHKRIDANDAITNGIHKLAANVETLTLQVKMLTERIEEGLKSQGERIGALEKEPGQKWKTVTGQLIQLAVAAVAGGVLMRFLG